MCEVFRGGVRATCVRIKVFINVCNRIFLGSKTWSMTPHCASDKFTLRTLSVINLANVSHDPSPGLRRIRVGV